MVVKADITIDIDKQVGNLQNLTNIYNARVGDSNTPLTVLWQKNGIALNLKGLHAFIAGTVGDGYYNAETDKVDFPIGSPVVKYEDDGSGTLDNGQSGLTTLLIPKQMWSKAGIFAGYIGLKDENGSVFTSKDIFFKVLGNVLDAGVEINYFIDDLDKALAEAQADTQKVISDARNSYTTETANAHDALIALQAELSRTREDNNNLSDLIQSVVNNIKANNIVTHPEYDKLANEIVNRLSQINTTPSYYNNYNDMVAANPNGTQNLCVTADNQHKWLYINSQWVDLGEFSYADIAPDEKNSLFSSNPNNVLVNPDMRNDGYGWNITTPWTANSDYNIGNSQAYGIQLEDEPQQGQKYEIYQNPIPVYKHKLLSAGVKVTANGAESAMIQILFRDANNNIIDNAVYRELIPQNISDWQTVKLENITIPSNAVNAAFTIMMSGKGTLNICQPMVNFESHLLPYSIEEARKQLSYQFSYNQDNALLNPDMRNGAYGWNIDAPWTANSENNIDNSQSYGIYVKNEPPEGVDYKIYQNPIPVYKHKLLSAGVKVMTNGAESAMIQVHFIDANNNIINNAISTAPIPQNIFDWYTVKLENISIPDNAVSAVFTIAMNGNGTLNICQPIVNFDSYLLPYSTKDVQEQLSYNQDNVLVNPDMRNDGYGWNITTPWTANSDYNIDNSQAYSIQLEDEPQQGGYKIYQNPIPVYKHDVLSAGVKVTANGAESAMIQILFRDTNYNIINSAVYRELIPQNITGWHTVKLENITIPSNAVNAAFTIMMSGKGTLNICQPMVNFESHLLPYSIKKSSEHKLPYFVFDTDSANVNDKWITTPFTYNDGIQELQGYAKIAIQGDSSRNFPKKNYKIKIYSDADCENKIKVRLKPSWSKLSNFNLKANFIDATQSRNLVNAHLIANATANTPIKDATVVQNLSNSQNFGQMEGFPIEVWFGNNYNGLYSCNTKKTDKVFGMDSNEKGTGVISVLDNFALPSSQLLKVPTAKLDNVAYADELHDTPDPELVTNWSKWLDFLNNSTDDDFKANIDNYIDVNAAINIYLFGVMSREYDYESKSILFLTWNNGKYYYPIAYDLDSNWGQSVSGKIEGNPQDSTWGFSTTTANKQDGKYVSNNGQNKLFERLYKLFKPEIKAQYLKLRSTVWRTDQILNAFKDYMDAIPEAIFEKDHKLWAQIPDVDKNDYGQLHSVITERCNQMDNWIEQLVPPVQPTQPTQTTQTGSQPTTSKPATTTQTTEVQQTTGQTATTATTDSKSTGTTTTDGK